MDNTSTLHVQYNVKYPGWYTNNTRNNAWTIQAPYDSTKGNVLYFGLK